MNVGDLVVQPRRESMDRRFFGYGAGADGCGSIRFDVYCWYRNVTTTVVDSGTGNRRLPAIIERPSQ